MIVGLNKYKENELYGCVNDARCIKGLLETNGDGSPNFDVKIIEDICTKRELLSDIEKCFLESYCETSLFYFSGHGWSKAYGAGIITTDDQDISMNDILNLVNKSNSRNKVVILDCCYSGYMGNKDSEIDEASLKNGVTILTACTETQVSLEKGEHGLFTSLLIDSLKGEAADIQGFITLSSVYSYIDKSLGAWDQRPVFKTNVNSFSPLRTVEPRIDRKILRNISKHFTNPNNKFSLDPSFEFTNNPNIKHEFVEPYAISKNTEKFKELQKLASVGLIKACDEDHMYFAAMNSKSCELTAVGKHYWRLSKNNKM